MKCAEIKYYLSDYSRGLLLDEIRLEIHEHLNSCNNCAKLYDELITLRSKSGLKSRINESQPKVKVKIHKNVRAYKTSHIIFPTASSSNPDNEFSQSSFLIKNNVENQKLFILTGIISALAFGVIFAFIYFDNSPRIFGTIKKISGFPVINSKIVTDNSILKIGENLTTDSESRARLVLASIGEIDVEPQTEIKIIETESSEYQLVLSKGKISVRTWEAPKLFSIETPSSSIKDFGSVYYLSVDEKSQTKLQVKSGWVLMETKNNNSLCNEESMCYADQTDGAGIPFSINASDTFQKALYKLNFEKGGEEELTAVLSESRKDDLISLFYLLIRSKQAVREKILDRITQLHILPHRITRQEILSGDREILARLWTGLGLGSISVYQNL